MSAAGEVHISSLVVHVRPQGLMAAKCRIASLPGTEIRGESALGKLVVVLETGTSAQVTDRIEQINEIPDVLGSSLVYHQFDSAAG